MVFGAYIQFGEVPVHLVDTLSEVARFLCPISVVERIEGQVARRCRVLARCSEAVVRRVEELVVAVHERSDIELGVDIDPACPAGYRDVPLSARAGHVGCRPAGAEAGAVGSVGVPVPVYAVVQVRVDGLDHPGQLGLAAGQVLRVVVPIAILQCAQPERFELAALGAVQSKGTLVVRDVGIGVAGIARAHVDLHQSLNLDVADRLVDGDAPVDLPDVRDRGPLLVVVEGEVAVVRHRPLQCVVVAYGEICEGPHQVVGAIGELEGLVDPDAALLGGEVDFPPKAVGVELVVVVPHKVVRSENGLQ